MAKTRKPSAPTGIADADLDGVVGAGVAGGADSIWIDLGTPVPRAAPGTAATGKVTLADHDFIKPKSD